MADHLGRDALADLALGARVERQREVGMGLDVDEAGRDDEALGVDRMRRIGARRIGAERGDAVSGNGDIGAIGFGAAAVDDAAAANENVALRSGGTDRSFDDALRRRGRR